MAIVTEEVEEETEIDLTPADSMLVRVVETSDKRRENNEILLRQGQPICS